MRRASRCRQGRHPALTDREHRPDRRCARASGIGYHRRDPRAAAPRGSHRGGPRRRGTDQAHR